MILRSCLAVLLICHVTLAGAAASQVLQADFSGPVLDSQWTERLQPGFSYTVGNGELRVQFAHDGGSAHDASGGLIWNLGLTGDYAVRVTVDVSDMVDVETWSGFMNGGAYVFSPTGAAFVGPWRYGSGATVNGAFFLDEYSSGAELALPSTSLDILIERQGDTVTESVAVAGSGDYQLLNAVSDPLLLGSTSIYLDIYYQGMAAVSGASIGYSNLSVTVPAISEPASVLMLCAGLALVVRRVGVTHRRGKF